MSPFQALQAMSKKQQDQLKLTCEIAYDPENHEKNRYTNIVPCE